MADKEQRRRRQFTQEFKRDAVDLVHSTGRPIAQIADELGIYDSTLGNWVRQDRIDRGEAEGLTTEERARLRQLEPTTPACGWSVTCSNEPWPSGSKSLDAVSRYRCVDTQKAAGFPVTASCTTVGVSASAYYAWAARRAQAAAAKQLEAELVSEIRAIHTDSRGTYGSPRVHAALRRRGQMVNRKRVERLMRTHGIVGHRPHRRRSLTRPDTAAAPAPELLGRLFDPDRPDVAWCGDVTYIPTDEGWLYLASVIDLASRHLLGWSMGAHHDAALVTGALDAAVAARGRQRMEDTIFHTDRGAEYTSSACIDACTRLGLRRSMGRTGSCLDNAVAESWFASLKVELVDRSHYRTRAEARAAIFTWIHHYNRRRLHSTIGYLPPVEWERRYALAHPLPSTAAA